MDELLKLLNSMPLPEQQLLAMRCKTSVNYLRKACSKGQLLGPLICVAIEQETGKKVTRLVLRPDDWHLIWPELAQSEAA